MRLYDFPGLREARILRKRRAHIIAAFGASSMVDQRLRFTDVISGNLKLLNYSMDVTEVNGKPLGRSSAIRLQPALHSGFPARLCGLKVAWISSIPMKISMTAWRWPSCPGIACGFGRCSSSTESFPP